MKKVIIIILTLLSLTGFSQGNFFGSYSSPTTLTIGSSYQGGIIAYVYVSGDPGYVSGENHGFIAASSDQGTSTPWGGYGTTTYANRTALGEGDYNTYVIVTTLGAGTYAAKLCDDLSLNGYADWSLPSIEELRKMHLNRDLIGGFYAGTGTNYWSSTETSNAEALLKNFLTNGDETTAVKNSNQRVRAIRYF